MTVQRLSAQDKRIKALQERYSYLDSRKQVLPGKGVNFALIQYIGNYYKHEEGSEKRLLSIVDNLQTAHYLARVIKQRDKLDYLPIIERTDNGLYPAKSDQVTKYLAAEREELKGLHSQKQREQEEREASARPRTYGPRT